MAPLRVLVCLLGLVVLCHSDCFFQELTVRNPKELPKGCMDKNGEVHEFGSEWVTDCNECSCSRRGMSCCNMMPDTDAKEIPEDCELLMNKAACSAKLVMKGDKTKDCHPV